MAEIKEEALKEAFDAHNEKYITDPANSHVFLLFGDGELCYTKAGQLFGMRNLHVFATQKFTDGTSYDFPFTFNGYKCIVLNDETVARYIRDLM